MDVIAEEVKDSPWSMMFADDIVLCSMEREVEEETEKWRILEERELRVSRKKTEYMQFNEAVNRNIRMQDSVLKKVKCFKYLGSTLSGNGELEGEVERRIQGG